MRKRRQRYMVFAHAVSVFGLKRDHYLGDTWANDQNDAIDQLKHRYQYKKWHLFVSYYAKEAE